MEGESDGRGIGALTERTLEAVGRPMHIMSRPEYIAGQAIDWIAEGREMPWRRSSVWMYSGKFISSMAQTGLGKSNPENLIWWRFKNLSMSSYVGNHYTDLRGGTKLEAGGYPGSFFNTRVFPVELFFQIEVSRVDGHVLWLMSWLNTHFLIDSIRWDFGYKC